MEPEETIIEHDIKVMTYEVDFAGIVSNQVYFRWLEDMRMHLLCEYIDMRELLKRDSIPVLAHTEIDYKRPLKLLDDVKGVMWVEELKGVKWALAAEFRRGDEVCAKARQWGVFIDTETFRPKQAPKELPRVERQEKRA